jgi:hypothetical protein
LSPSGPVGVWERIAKSLLICYFWYHFFAFGSR